MTAVNLAAVRAGIQETHRALLRPSAEGLERILPVLEQAAASLTVLRREVQSGISAAGLERALAEVAGQVRHSRALLDTAAGWHAGWARLLYTAAAGYTALGEPAPLPLGRTVSLEG